MENLWIVLPLIATTLGITWFLNKEWKQTILRRENYPKPYEALKDLTRTNKKITQKEIQVFIKKLKVSVKVKNELSKITPHNYTGVAI